MNPSLCFSLSRVTRAAERDASLTRPAHEGSAKAKEKETGTKGTCDSEASLSLSLSRQQPPIHQRITSAPHFTVSLSHSLPIFPFSFLRLSSANWCQCFAQDAFFCGLQTDDRVVHFREMLARKKGRREERVRRVPAASAAAAAEAAVNNHTLRSTNCGQSV